MIKTKRQATIWKMLQDSGSVELKAIVQHIGISRLMAHRDLEALAASGKCIRVQGGAILPEETSDSPETQLARAADRLARK